MGLGPGRVSSLFQKVGKGVDRLVLWIKCDKWLAFYPLFLVVIIE